MNSADNGEEIVWISERLIDGKSVKIQHTVKCLESWKLTPSAGETPDLGDDAEGLPLCEHQIWVSPHRIVDWTK